MTTYFKEDPYIFTQDKIGDTPFIYKHIPTSPCIHIRLVFDYGAMYDSEGKEGEAHFLEHMLFKGSELFADEKAVDNFSKVYTLKTLNAYTSFYNFSVVGRTLSENTQTVLNGMFDMLINAKLRDQDVENERKVIIQEIWRSYHNEKYINYSKKYVENNLYDVPVQLRMGRAFGWVETVNNIKAEDLQRAKNKFLVKSNLKVFIAGNLENLENIKEIVKANLDKMPEGERTISPYVPEVIHKPKVNLFSNEYGQVGLGNSNQATIEYELIMPKFDIQKDAKKVATLALISLVLNELVYEKLRTENNLCYSASVTRNSNSAFTGFYISSKLNSAYIDKATMLIEEILENYKQGVHEKVFTESKKLIIDRLVSNERLTSDLIDNVVNDIKIFGVNVGLNPYIQELEQVTYQDTVDFAKQYFNKDQFVLEILKPNKKNLFNKFTSLFSKKSKA
jgi:predicted Zn-dependent peptidase